MAMKMVAGRGLRFISQFMNIISITPCQSSGAQQQTAAEMHNHLNIISRNRYHLQEINRRITNTGLRVAL